MAHDPHIVPRVPRLTGLAWPHVAPYLEEFLKRLLAASDSAHIDLAAISVGGEGDSPLSRRVAYPHTHHFIDVHGLEKEYAPRPPRPHIHGVQDIAGLGPLLAGGALATARPAPHTHHLAEVVGAIGDTQLVLTAQVFGGL